MQEDIIACLAARRKLIINACLLVLSVVTNTINNLVQLQNRIRERHQGHVEDTPETKAGGKMCGLFIRKQDLRRH